MCVLILVSCTMWEKKEVKKADLSVLDISSAIIARVEEIPEQMDYFYLGKLCYIKSAFTVLIIFIIFLRCLLVCDNFSHAISL